VSVAQAIPSAQRRPDTVAAFDFDGTLVRGGSVLPFLVDVCGPFPVARAVVGTLPQLVRGALAGGTAADAAKEELFARVLTGRPVEVVERRSRRFAERHLRRRLRAKVVDRLEWHRRQGHAVLIVSASPECYVRAAGELLGVDGVIATRLQVGGGLLTGRYEGKNCRGSEKFARVMGWLRAEGLTGNGAPQPVLWAYGNSRGDLRLLSAADHGIDVGRLGRLGRLHRFARLESLAHVPDAAEDPGPPPVRRLSRESPRRPRSAPGTRGRRW
jgi:phosphatidylglycerophosphatase C